MNQIESNIFLDFIELLPHPRIRHTNSLHKGIYGSNCGYSRQTGASIEVNIPLYHTLSTYCEYFDHAAIIAKQA